MFWLVTVVAAAVLPTAGGALEPQAPEQEQQVVEPPAEPVADLRIVRIAVTPSPLRNGLSATASVLVHNRSPFVVTGRIAVELTHDRATRLPLPLHRELYYLEPDALAEVTFEVPAVTLDASPYTFFATVDVLGEVDEDDKANNTAWERLSVCEGPDVVEAADGFDNDCDGMTDEGIGETADPAAALRMLRALQRQAALDGVLLIYATPRLFAPDPVEYAAQLQSEEGPFLGVRNGTDVSADFAEDAPETQLRLVDWNGGDLRSGDLVSLRARRAFVVAEGGGGGRLIARDRFRERERLLSVVFGGASGAAGGPGAIAGGIISDGDMIALASSTGHFLSAEQGGGGPVSIDRAEASGWEHFTLRLREQEP